MGKRAVLLFAGQGAQSVGMGQDLAEAYDQAGWLFSRADEVLGFPLTEKMFQGPASELTRTSVCQPALYVHGLACLDLLRQRVPDLEVVGTAGLSLGEFTAHAAAGTYDFETGLKLVAQRGRFMEEATDRTTGTMAALIGGEEADVVALAEKCDIDVANFNAPGQIVVSGKVEGVEQAISLAADSGVRIAQKLDVAGAYHSRLMQSAQDQLAGVLRETAMESPGVPVVANVDAALTVEVDDIRRKLEAQVTGSVRWSDSIRTFLDRGETLFIELGPGRVLTGLMKRIDRSAQALSISDVESLEAAVQALSAE